MSIKVVFTRHAEERMARYGVSRELVDKALENPDEIIPGYKGRLIAHKYLNGYVLRVVFEERGNVIVVVTVYKARRERYAEHG